MYEDWVDTRRMVMKKLLLPMIAAVVLVACSTVEGVGKDIQKAGEKIEDAAKKK
jgi:predicted small secreted protein